MIENDVVCTHSGYRFFEETHTVSVCKKCGHSCITEHPEKDPDYAGIVCTRHKKNIIKDIFGQFCVYCDIEIAIIKSEKKNEFR